MTPFHSITCTAAPLLRENIDTDTIIPSREIKRVSKEGLAEGLFADWRYASPESRDPDPTFILNQPPFNSACVLVTGRNFGCGSSREHAVWALREWGICAIIAPAYGSIFRSNCIRNGLLPVTLDEETTNRIARTALADSSSAIVTVDLVNKIVGQGESAWPFDIAEQERQMLLEGLDFIDLTLQDLAVIKAFEARDRKVRPWAYL